MYTIIVQDDNTLSRTKIETIMCRSKLVNNLHFLMNPTYKDIDMSTFSATIEYRLPVSKEYHTEILTVADDLYKDEWLEYVLPFDTQLTKEPGNIELQLTFTDAITNDDGTISQYVRKTQPTTIYITPISAWGDQIPDAALTAIDQRLIKMDTIIENLNTVIAQLNANKADNIAVDSEGKIYLTSNGNKIGNSITVSSTTITNTTGEMTVVNI